MIDYPSRSVDNSSGRQDRVEIFFASLYLIGNLLRHFKSLHYKTLSTHIRVDEEENYGGQLLGWWGRWDKKIRQVGVGRSSFVEAIHM